MIAYWVSFEDVFVGGKGSKGPSKSGQRRERIV